MNNFSYIELAILQMLETQNLHGYAMSAQMQLYSGGDLQLPAGSLYPALHKLERQRYITSSTQRQGGRMRRTYELTPDGLQVLEQEKQSWRVIVKTMNALLGA